MSTSPARSLKPTSFIAATPSFRDGTSTPRALLETCLETIARLEPEVHAFTYLDLEGARRYADEASARWRQARPHSRVDGMPIGVKDVIGTRDMPTGMGSALFEGWRPDDDAASVVALREAGAVVVGKTVTTEFAATVPGKTRNPHDLERTPGGSSSGSAAAVGSGMLPAGLGTQVVGSTVRPASFCGCVGFKPSVGALNRGGALDYMSQSVTGVLGATLGDAWAVACEIANRVGGDPGHPGLVGSGDLPAPRNPRRVALLLTGGEPDADTQATALLEQVRRTLVDLGVEVVDEGALASLRLVNAAASLSSERTMKINGWEFLWPLNAFAQRDASKLSANMRERLENARGITAGEHRARLAQRDCDRSLYAALARDVDACITLAASGPAPKGVASTGSPAFAVPASYFGVPALSLPAGLIDDLPIGVQLVGFRDRDEDLVAVGSWFQQSVLT